VGRPHTPGTFENIIMQMPPEYYWIEDDNHIWFIAQPHELGWEVEYFSGKPEVIMAFYVGKKIERTHNLHNSPINKDIWIKYEGVWVIAITLDLNVYRIYNTETIINLNNPDFQDIEIGERVDFNPYV
jgi:hypothetical protein